MSARRSVARISAELCLVLALGSALPLAADASDLAWLDGTWIGTGHQLGNGDEWTIEVTADSATGRFEISYTSLGCAGTWELTSSDGDVAWFVESLSEGLDTCVDGGTVAIARISDRFVSYSFFYPDADTLDSFSTMERR